MKHGCPDWDYMEIDETWSEYESCTCDKLELKELQMPAQAKTADQFAKKYNPTVTAMFRNEKFGDEALLSVDLDAKGFEAIQKHAQIGVKFLIKKAARLNKNGGATFYLEILPPLADTSKLQGRRATPPAEDDI